MLIKAPSIISVAFFIMTIHMSIFRFRLWTQNDVCIVNKYLFKYVSSHSFHIILTHISQSLIEITNTTNALRACDHWPGPGSSQHWPVTRSRLVSGPRLPDIWPSPPQLSLLPRQCRHRVNTEHKFLQLTFSRERSTGGQLCTRQPPASGDLNWARTRTPAPVFITLITATTPATDRENGQHHDGFI